MGANSAIHWTDHTYNPWWGCQRVSPGCEHCYAETFAKRTGHDIWGPTTERRIFGPKHWAEPLKWNAKAPEMGHRPRVFCASMADVFEDRRDLDEPRAQLFDLIEKTPNLDWLLLTKRPEQMMRLTPPTWKAEWPRNIWAGTTVESQEYAEKRVLWLLEVPAAVRFLSCEPLLGPVDLTRIAVVKPEPGDDLGVWLNGLTGLLAGPDEYLDGRAHLNWVIGGGESGPGRRPFDEDWARTIREQCQSAGVAYFHKQGSGPRPGMNRELDGQLWEQYPEPEARA
jgi:protein gp37